MSDTYCPLIHYGLATSPVGGYRPCCDFHETWSVRTPLNEYKNSIIYKDLLDAEKNNKWHPGCANCEIKERQGASSKRLREIKNFENKSAQKEKIYLLDLRLGNKCNMACVSCNPKNSSKIYQEVDNVLKGYNSHDMIDKSLELPVHFTRVYETMNDLKRFHLGHNKEFDFTNPYSDEEILDLLNNIDPYARIYFTGGEPTVIKGVRKCLDKMIELGLNKTIQLEFNSNFLAWNDIWFDRVTKFKGLMMASIDDIGLRAEYTRYQTDWKRVEENFKKFVEISHDWEINVAPTISILNILYLDDIINWCRQLNVHLSFTNPLIGPPWMNIRNLPEEAKVQVKSYLQKHEDIKGVDSIVKILNQKPNRNINSIKQQFEKVDALRKTNWKKTYPELAEFLGK